MPSHEKFCSEKNIFCTSEDLAAENMYGRSAGGTIQLKRYQSREALEKRHLLKYARKSRPIKNQVISYYRSSL